MSLLAFLLSIALLIMVLNMRGRVQELERALKNRPLQSTPPQQPASLNAPPTQTSTAAPTTAAAQPSVPVAPPVEHRLIAWLKENWLLKLGALLFLIGFGWLVTYAFLNNWIGPMGRITFGLCAGAAILALGFWRMRLFVTQGAVFVALGATVVLLTTYAARSIYDFFTPLTALTLMFATCALVTLISGMYNRRALAITGIILAGMAPILAHWPSPDYIEFFWYLLVVVLGSVWIVVWKDFREVILVALAIVSLYSLPLLVGLERADMPALLLFAYFFAAIFYITNAAGLLRLKGTSAVVDLVTAAGNALFLLIWIHVAGAKETESLMIAAWATAFVVGAFWIFRVSGEKAPLYMYAGIGVAYIAAATAVELSGAALTIAYTFEAAAVVLCLYVLTRDVIVAQRATILFGGPILLAIPSIVSSQWRFGVFNEHFFVLAALSAAFFAVGFTLWAPSRKSVSPERMHATNLLLIIGSAYAYVLLWLSLHAALPEDPDTAVMIALSIYTIIGIAAYLEGFKFESKALRIYGGALLLSVVGRLLVVDVWQMELTGRIITFFLIGTLLMSTAFLSHFKKRSPIPPSNNV